MEEYLCSCFVAYPSGPPALAETIESAIGHIDDSGLVSIQSWKSTAVSGKFVITAICDAIDEMDIFICDLTYLNHNVLFELGFAIAKGKRVWLLHNPSIEDSVHDFENFGLLTTVGHVPYANSTQIADHFYEDQPYEDLEDTIYREAMEPLAGRVAADKLLYLKSAIPTDASIKLSRRISNSSINSVVDDPSEVRIQTLSWYAEKVFNSFAVVAHFVSNEHQGQRLQNAKNSLISGLSFGLGRPLLMLAHEPYKSPIDYRELLSTHDTAAKCEEVAEAWLTDIETRYAESRVEIQTYTSEIRASSELQQINIGDPVAEHESETLSDYFVPTQAYTEALESGYSVVIGRKGTGKTAILYNLSDELASDPRNHVCQVIPIGYELDGVIRMVQQAMATSERGFLMECFWKFLIHTELAKSIPEVLAAKPAHYKLDSTESALEEFVESNVGVILPEFSVRLESIVHRLQDMESMERAADQRVRISELMHDNIIAKLRQLTGAVLQHKKKVVVLIDNLDKAWNRQQSMVAICDLIHALMDVSHQISADFHKSTQNLAPANVSVIVFLRSDIFQQVINLAPERDKLYFTRLEWSDQEVLLDVLEQRFLSSNPNLPSPSVIWSKYFAESVEGIPTRDYLTQSILPRPRDLIYLVRNALTLAVNRRHTYITEDDIVDAQRHYSQYALDSLDAENGVQLDALKQLLYEFVAAPKIVNRDDILTFMKNCGIPDHKYIAVVDLLCGLTFLGREVADDRFEFQQTEQHEAKYVIMARRVAGARPDGTERFQVARPFHSYLEIK